MTLLFFKVVPNLRGIKEKGGLCLVSYELNMEDILSDENLQEAMDSFRDKRDSNGVDAVKISELGEYWTLNSEK